MLTENNTTNINSNNFSFDESKFRIKSRAILGAPEVPKMIRILVKKGFVKNEVQAITLLLVSVVVLVGVSVFLINRSVSVPPAVISPELLSDN